MDPLSALGLLQKETKKITTFANNRCQDAVTIFGEIE